MVATRSTRASARLKQNEAVEPVEETMEEKVENNVEKEKSPECSECNDNSKEPTKDRINEVIESKVKDEKEEDAVKPDRTGYLKGFVKRVVMCTILVMAAKNAWPYLQSRFWPEEPAKEGKLYILNDKSFRGHVSRGDHIVMMYAPWCGHCQRLKPDWEKLAKKPGVAGVSVSKVDCTASTGTCGEYSVQGYPTLLYFRDGKKIDTYDGAKTLDGLETYLKKMKKGGSKDTKKKTAKKPTTPVKTKKKKKTAKAEL
eukprot:TRINITY_DN4824_c0_g1_i1.p1 TRINITY_DN4824_c0_g1~~TRINITY_DN4824_c0_g1_i1.p1  ORF type:complete len:256 (-),score=98.53 TRINITY_DN4824_c0_g1_i1:130-897(-)